MQHDALITDLLKRARLYERDRDYPASFASYLKAAELGHPPSQFYCGATLAQGTCGQKQDQQAAAAWIKKSADQNYAPAFAALAHFLSCGKGVVKDEKS